MVTADQLATETRALVKLSNDPRFSAARVQWLIGYVLNELAWVKANETLVPVSQMLLDDLEQGLI